MEKEICLIKRTMCTQIQSVLLNTFWILDFFHGQHFECVTMISDVDFQWSYVKTKAHSAYVPQLCINFVFSWGIIIRAEWSESISARLRAIRKYE